MIDSQATYSTFFNAFKRTCFADDWILVIARRDRTILSARSILRLCEKWRMLRRFTVTICVTSLALGGGKWRLLFGRPCDLWHSIFGRSCRFSGATIVSFSAIATVWEYGRGFCSQGWVSSCHHSGRFRPRSWVLLLVRHCRHRLVKSQGGCSIRLKWQLRFGSRDRSIMGNFNLDFWVCDHSSCDHFLSCWEDQ